MGFHTFPVERADALDDPVRYRFCSREELLELLDPSPGDRVMDLGSGTGFFATDVAPFVGTLFAVDLQPAMHRRFRAKGLPGHVHLLTAEASALSLATDALDLAFSVDTHHEYYSPTAMDELARVLRPGGRMVTVDWSADGAGAEGPPVDERYGPDEIVAQLTGAGFEIVARRTRPETVAIAACRPSG